MEDNINEVYLTAKESKERTQLCRRQLIARQIKNAQNKGFYDICFYDLKNLTEQEIQELLNLGYKVEIRKYVDRDRIEQVGTYLISWE